MVTSRNSDAMTFISLCPIIIPKRKRTLKPYGIEGFAEIGDPKTGIFTATGGFPFSGILSVYLLQMTFL